MWIAAILATFGVVANFVEGGVTPESAPIRLGLGSIKPSLMESSIEKDLTITASQKIILDKFRKNIEGRLPHEYMYNDLYLVRWLRAKNFKLIDAEEMLMRNILWREDERMDTIHEEDWAHFKANYPYYLSMVDKEGKPVLYFHPGGWNLRAIAVSGQAERFRRFVDSAIDASCTKVRYIQENFQNVTQGVVLINLDGYNIVEHACLQCIPIILRGILTYEKYYPGCAEKIILVNTPLAFEPLLQNIRGVISQGTNKSLKIFGANKSLWKSYVFQHISKDQLPYELGGSVHLDESDY